MVFKRIIHSVFLARKSRGGESAVGWQVVEAVACRLMVDRRPRDFRAFENNVDNVH